MKTTVRLLKPFMARPVGTVLAVGTVEADLLIERGAAEAVSAEGEEGQEPNGAPSTPPQTTAGVTSPPQTKTVNGPQARPALGAAPSTPSNPSRGRLAAPRRK